MSTLLGVDPRAMAALYADLIDATAERLRAVLGVIHARRSDLPPRSATTLIVTARHANGAGCQAS